jgi:hypothetical protein
VLDAGEILATSAMNGAVGQEYIQNFAVTQGQQLLVRVMSQVAGGSTNYTLQAIADYATGGNTTGALPGARDLTLLSAGSIYEYLDSSADFYDTFKIAPPTGQFQAKLTMLEAGASHMLQIIRDGNNNGVVDSGEVVASGYTGTVLSYNITSGATYYLRVMSVLAGEFYSVGNYKLSWAGANSVTGWTLSSPANITVGSNLAAIGGYVAYDPTDPGMTNIDDYYRFTLSTRQRFDVYTNPPAGMVIGVQVGQVDGGGNFVRIGGAGAYDQVVTSLSLNLDPGTYYIRTFLPVAERQQTASGGNYGLFFKTAAITDNSPPLVTAAVEQYEVAPLGVIFTLDQDVLGSVDASDVVVKNIATNVTYPISRTFYDPATHRAGYGFAAGTLPDGNYRATLLAGSLKDASLNPLASDYNFDFYVLAGDANRDRKVDAADLGILSLNWQGSGKTFSQGDFNYDGKVDISDLYILSSRWKQALAPPAPPPPAQPVSIAVGAPRRTATRVVSLLQED